MAKKIHTSWQRSYRSALQEREGERAFQLVLGESDVRIMAGLAQGGSEACYETLRQEMLVTLGQLRADIQSWARLYPDFQHSLAPLALPSQGRHMPEIVRRMYVGAERAGVGPFAAVAGTVSHMLAEAHAHKAPDLIIENGGDVYMYSTKDRTVALLASPQGQEDQKPEQEQKQGGASLGLHFKAEDFPLALCASSATIGHSLSLGTGELAVVRARDGALADAVATALGNRLRGAQTVQSALDFAQNIAGVEGLFVQCDDALGIWGNMELVAV